MTPVEYDKLLIASELKFKASMEKAVKTRQATLALKRTMDPEDYKKMMIQRKYQKWCQVRMQELEAWKAATISRNLNALVQLFSNGIPESMVKQIVDQAELKYRLNPSYFDGFNNVPDLLNISK